MCFNQQGEEGQGDQDQEERRWNKRTQQMLHGLQVCIWTIYVHEKNVQNRFPHCLLCFGSAWWLKLEPSPSACLSCAKTTTTNRLRPSFTASWCWRSSRPSSWRRPSRTATSSPRQDRGSILYRCILSIFLFLVVVFNSFVLLLLLFVPVFVLWGQF